MESTDWHKPLVQTLGDIMDVCERIDESAIDALEAEEWQRDVLLHDHWEDYWEEDQDVDA